MRNISAFCLLVLAFVISTSQAEAQNWLIIPGQSVGQINRNTSEAELIKIFGSTNVKRVAVDVGEGETVPGTVIFPTDARKTAYILWRDATDRRRPESVRINSKSTLWKTDRGITIGTSLRTIERLNGKAFALTGFGWDYSGTLLHSNGGMLGELGNESGEDITGRTLILRLEPRRALQRTREYQAAQGDGKFLSSDPAMQKLNPLVYEIIVEFPL